MKQRAYPSLLFIALFLPIFSFADEVNNPISPYSPEFPFIVAGVAAIGIAIFVFKMMRRKKNK